MGTQEIKDELKARYPGEKFSRRNKIVDGLYYTHRTFESSQRIVVVTCDYEDEEICDIVEVKSIPRSQNLKDESRPWMPNGPLSEYYYALGPDYIGITEKYFYDTTGAISDSEAKNSYIFHHTGLEPLMESAYEYNEQYADEVTSKKLLDALGATQIFLDEIDETETCGEGKDD